MTDSTLSGNSATYGGGGIVNDTGTVNVGATIVANSPSGDDCLGSGIADQGYNIADDGSCGFTATASINGVNPLLGTLANNGGPTETLLPASTSPAVGAIPTGITLNGIPVCPRSDQRGVASVGNCTIGAVEVPRCAAGLHPYVLNASYPKGTFTGLFCVNAKTYGTYTQGGVTGPGRVYVFKGYTIIIASGTQVRLEGITKGTYSKITEIAPKPVKTGTFKLT